MKGRNTVLPDVIIDINYFYEFPNGNYQKNTDIDLIKYQFDKKFIQSSQQNQLCYIVTPSIQTWDRERIRKPLKESSGLSAFLFRNRSAVSVSTIPNLNLTCCDVSSYFNVNFKSAISTIGDEVQNTKEALNDSASVVIFSNDVEQINTICNDVKILSNGYAPPFIFIATTNPSLNVDAIKASIVDVISMDTSLRVTTIDIEDSCLKAIEISNGADGLWQTIREKIDALARVAEEINPTLGNGYRL